MNELKVVMHLSDERPESLKNLFSEIYSIIDSAKGININIEVIITDKAVFHFLKGNVNKFTIETIKELIGSGVKFNVCNISLRSMGISFDDLVDGLNKVDSGILKIIELVNSGFIYIKP